MKPKPHLLRLQFDPAQRACEALRLVSRRERRAPGLFPALVFPTPHQFNNDLPFTVNSRPHRSPLT